MGITLNSLAKQGLAVTTMYSNVQVSILKTNFTATDKAQSNFLTLGFFQSACGDIRYDHNTAGAWTRQNRQAVAGKAGGLTDDRVPSVDDVEGEEGHLDGILLLVQAANYG